jgi:hypothetical protein
MHACMSAHLHTHKALLTHVPHKYMYTLHIHIRIHTMHTQLHIIPTFHTQLHTYTHTPAGMMEAFCDAGDASLQKTCASMLFEGLSQHRARARTGSGDAHAHTHTHTSTFVSDFQGAQFAIPNVRRTLSFPSTEHHTSALGECVVCVKCV